MYGDGTWPRVVKHVFLPAPFLAPCWPRVALGGRCIPHPPSVLPSQPILLPSSPPGPCCPHDSAPPGPPPPPPLRMPAPHRCPPACPPGSLRPPSPVAPAGTSSRGTSCGRTPAAVACGTWHVGWVEWGRRHGSRSWRGGAGGSGLRLRWQVAGGGPKRAGSGGGSEAAERVGGDRWEPPWELPTFPTSDDTVSDSLLQKLATKPTWHSTTQSGRERSSVGGHSHVERGRLSGLSTHHDATVVAVWWCTR